jgi:CelD/BcsL family acetyltransferase involved in cellulose biosynthesis
MGVSPARAGSVRVNREKPAVIVANRPDDLTPHVPAWDELARAALEPNVFQESWMVRPGWRAFGSAAAIEAVFIYRDRLDGVFILERMPRLYGLPIQVLRSWAHPYSPLGTPLIRADAAAECLHALFDWLARQPGGAPTLEIVNYGADGPFQRVLLECLRQRRLSRFEAGAYRRAILRRGDNAGDVVAGAVSPAHRKELRRKRRRLEESGRLEWRALEPDERLDRWTRMFLDLERAGWKGRAHTALASDPGHAAFFEDIVRAAHAQGRLRLSGLFLDDRPVAMKCSLVAPPGAFAWKIAFDEHFAYYSPGVLLELDHAAALHAEGDIDWMDSCKSEADATPGQLWKDQRTIAVTLLSTGRSVTAQAFVSALGPLQRVYRTVRRPLSPRGARRPAPSSPAAAGSARAAPPNPAARP